MEIEVSIGDATNTASTMDLNNTTHLTFSQPQSSLLSYFSTKTLDAMNKIEGDIFNLNLIEAEYFLFEMGTSAKTLNKRTREGRRHRKQEKDVTCRIDSPKHEKSSSPKRIATNTFVSTSDTCENRKKRQTSGDNDDSTHKNDASSPSRTIYHRNHHIKQSPQNNNNNHHQDKRRSSKHRHNHHHHHHRRHKKKRSRSDRHRRKNYRRHSPESSETLLNRSHLIRTPPLPPPEEPYFDEDDDEEDDDDENDKDDVSEEVKKPLFVDPVTGESESISPHNDHTYCSRQSKSGRDRTIKKKSILKSQVIVVIPNSNSRHATNFAAFNKEQTAVDAAGTFAGVVTPPSPSSRRSEYDKHADEYCDVAARAITTSSSSDSNSNSSSSLLSTFNNGDSLKMVEIVNNVNNSMNDVNIVDDNAKVVAGETTIKRKDDGDLTELKNKFRMQLEHRLFDKSMADFCKQESELGNFIYNIEKIAHTYELNFKKR